MRILLAVVLVGAFFLSFRISGFHDTLGQLTPLACISIALLSAGSLLIAAWPTDWRKAACWFALYIVGQSFSLQLIDAGTRLHYQHYRLSQGDGGLADGIFLALLAIEAIVVFSALARHSRTIGTWIRNHIGLFTGSVVLLAAVVLATFPSEPLGAMGLDLAISGFVVITQAGCLLLGLLAIPTNRLAAWGDRIECFAQGPDRGSSRSLRVAGMVFDPLAFGCALWVTLSAATLSLVSYERHPHIADEFAYIMQARYFAEGQLGTPAPPVPEAVETYLWDCNDTGCSSPVPPGWPAVLSLGVRSGAPWLVNPLLSGINVILFFALLQLLYSRKAARLGVLLVSVSTWYLLLGMSFMTHVLSLTCTLIAAISVALMYRDKRLVWAFPGGAAIGLLSLTRPLEGVMVATVLGLASLFVSGRWYRQAAPIVLGTVTLAVAGLVFPYNKAMTGEATTFPIMAYADKVLGPGRNSLGFGPDKGMEWGGMDPFPGHGPADVVVNAILNLDGMNIEMFGWSIGSLLTILLFFTVRSGQGYFKRFLVADRWMLLFILVIFALQSLYWFSGGPDFAARYYFLIVIPLIALTVRSADYLGHALAFSGRLTFRQAQAGVLVALAVMSLSAMTSFLPWRAIDKYHNFRGNRPDIRTLIAEHDLANSIILVNARTDPDFYSALVYSSLDPFGSEPLVLLNRSPEVRQRVLSVYRDRAVWIVDSPSITGGRYRVVQGPVKAADLL